MQERQSAFFTYFSLTNKISKGLKHSPDLKTNVIKYTILPKKN